MPLMHGRATDGGHAWYILTESSNEDVAERLGINPAPKLANALGTKAVQDVTRENGTVHFSGTVDFSPKRKVVPSEPNGFPPDVAKPGAVGTPRTARSSPAVTASSMKPRRSRTPAVGTTQSSRSTGRPAR